MVFFLEWGMDFICFDIIFLNIAIILTDSNLIYEDLFTFVICTITISDFLIIFYLKAFAVIKNLHLHKLASLLSHQEKLINYGL